ncbi:tetratricopeptide repeat protein [Streptomyces sp. NPDC006487]|uniref:tetratricopeptide repeat protein n=1 Tax=Streptomyces sp. NPDC006487 TaxID=3364748 RepID=UPI0036835A61
MERRPRDASWKVTYRQISTWQNGSHLPATEEGFLKLVRVLTEHARGRAARGHQVGDLLDEHAWARLLRQAVAPGSDEPTSGTGDDDGGTADARFTRCLVGVVPSAADCFQDRGSATQLRGAIATVGTAVLSQVLAGTGGVGKTQLAANHARAMWTAGDLEVLVWVSAASRASIVSSYAEAAFQLGLAAEQGDVGRAAERFLAWAHTGTRSWVVVLDDIQQPDDVRGLWPSTGSVGSVVATTRLRGDALAGGGRQVIEVDLFTPSEARTYLIAKLAPQGLAGEAEQLDALAESLGRLPLALAQAAAYMIDQDLDCGVYRERLSAKLLEHVVPEPRDLPDDHQTIVTAAWDLSVEQANRARPQGLARPLLHLVSVMDPSGVPAAVLTSESAREYVSSCQLDDVPRSDGPGVEADDVMGALRVLHRFNLIDHNRRAPYQEVRVHNLIQRATRESLPPDQRARATYAVADALQEVWPEVERDQLGTVLRANTTALNRVGGDILWQWHGGAHPVLFHSAGSLGASGQAAAAVTEFIHLHSVACRSLGANHPDALVSRSRLGRWRGETGDAGGAVAAFEELLPDQIRVLGPDHWETLESRSNLASWRGETGDVSGAVAAFEELLPDQIRVLGPNHPETLNSRNNMAYWRGLTGDAAGAVAAFEELLLDQTRVLGSDHPKTLGLRSNVAQWRGESGDAAGAVAAYQALLADQVRVLGPDEPMTLIMRSNMAKWRGRAGDVTGALAAFEELMPDQVRVLGPDHPLTFMSRNLMANLRGESGDAERAVAEYEALLADRLRVLGTDHPDTQNARANLAFWQGRAGDAPGAAAAFKEVLADRARLLGPDHPDTLTARGNLAYWQGKAGDPAGALAAFGELELDLLRVIGPGDPRTLTFQSHLAHYQGEAGDAVGAVALLEELEPNFLRVFGPEHPRSLSFLEQLAMWRKKADGV